MIPLTPTLSQRERESMIPLSLRERGKGEGLLPPSFWERGPG
jgi:hypothetical protein